MAISQTSTQVQRQLQTLTPQQLLVAELTEMPIEELRERLDKEVLDNPSLESGDDGTADDGYASGDAEGSVNHDDGPTTDADDYGSDELPVYAQGTDRQRTEAVVGESLSFYDQLVAQIGLFDLSEHEAEVLRYVIGCLDDDGLLRTSLQQLQDELEVYHNIVTSEDELKHLIGILQNFEPAGIGARTLQECLLLQVDHSPNRLSHTRQQLRILLSDYFNLLMLKRWDKIRERMHLTDAEVARLQHEVRRLNPRPGSSLGDSESHSLQQQVNPDFFVETDPYGNIHMSLNNDGIPALRVNADDEQMLNAFESRGTKSLSRSEREGLIYVRDRVGMARNFIEAIRQRQLTLTKTMQAIVRLQKPFFLSGDETQLVPMTLDDVVRETGLHRSTVSRVSNSKWVQTTFGIYPLRWFFTSAARLGDSDVSVRHVKATLREIVEHENHDRPLSDDALTELLRQRGYDVARRTVTKYRVQLGIPVARLRRGG